MAEKAFNTVEAALFCRYSAAYTLLLSRQRDGTGTSALADTGLLNDQILNEAATKYHAHRDTGDIASGSLGGVRRCFAALAEDGALAQVSDLFDKSPEDLAGEIARLGFYIFNETGTPPAPRSAFQAAVSNLQKTIIEAHRYGIRVDQLGHHYFTPPDDGSRAPRRLQLL